MVKRVRQKKRRDPGTWVLLVRGFLWRGRAWWQATVYDASEQPFAGGVEPTRAGALRAALGAALERRGEPACVRVEPDVIVGGELAGLAKLAPVGPEHDELIERFAREVDDGAGDDDGLDLPELIADFYEVAGRAIEALEGAEPRLARVRTRGGPAWFAMARGGDTPMVIVSKLADSEALHAAITAGTLPSVRALAIQFRRADEVDPGMPPAMREGGWRHARMPCVSSIHDGRMIDAVPADLAELTDVLDLLFDDAGYEDVEVTWEEREPPEARVLN